ncbi:RBBP9/YdeN family alpha/beta hydrolase [Kribbella sp. C-35]|uniref:RBBP9/YdeN family alpha/beta hydrolase n=1 Tax=Kribbella sp. C-35 TaxID=2789276 RepID=UPI0039789C9E
MTAFVILPGIDGSDGVHWQSRWEESWGDRAVRIVPASWTEPELDDWVAAVQRAYDDARARDDDVVLVAHSLGCWAAAAWFAAGGSAAAALLVAPPDPEHPTFPSDRAGTFQSVLTQPLPCPALLVASTDDPYCTPERATTFASAWNADCHLVDHAGHLNSTTNLADWPLGRKLLNGLLGLSGPTPA